MLQKWNQESIYTSIFTVSRVVIWLFLKNHKIYLNSVCTKIFLGSYPKISKRVFVNIFKNKVRRAKKLSILLHFTFPYTVILLFLKNYKRYLNSDLTKTLPSACSKRFKKNLQIALKIKSPEWNNQTDRPTLNFIDRD